MLSPDAHFYTSSYGIGLKYYVERNGIKSDEKTFKKGIFKGLEVITKHDIYFDAARDGNFEEDMHQISVQINLDLNKNIFIAGQTSFASFGDAGAYAEGIVGLGARTNPLFNEKVTLFVQGLAGAAGAGGISTGEGFIIKPSTGLNYKISDNLSFRTAAGYVKAKGAGLSNTFINFGIKYHLSFLKMN